MQHDETHLVPTVNSTYLVVYQDITQKTYNLAALNSLIHKTTNLPGLINLKDQPPPPFFDHGESLQKKVVKNPAVMTCLHFCTQHVNTFFAAFTISIEVSYPAILPDVLKFEKDVMPFMAKFLRLFDSM